MPILYVCNKCGNQEEMTNVPSPQWTIIETVGPKAQVYCPECSKSKEVRDLQMKALVKELGN